MEKQSEICMDMLLQRNYSIVDIEDDRITAEKEDGEIICVFLSDIPRLNANKIQEYINEMSNLDITHSIIVYNDITPHVKKTVSNCNMKIELFTKKEMSINPTKNRLVPIHEKLPEDEGKEFKEKYKQKFAILRLSDPISRFYGYKKGDVIKITRKNGYIAYRIVC